MLTNTGEKMVKILFFLEYYLQNLKIEKVECTDWWTSKNKSLRNQVHNFNRVHMKVLNSNLRELQVLKIAWKRLRTDLWTLFFISWHTTRSFQGRACKLQIYQYLSIFTQILVVVTKYEGGSYGFTFSKVIISSM